jgi:hypothetical protein
MPSPLAEVEHRIPGRTRLRLRDRRRDAGFFTTLEAALREAPGVREVRADPRTGGVLVLHPDGEADRVFDFARDRGLFELARPAGAVPQRPRPAAAIVAAPPRALSVAAAGFAGLAVYQAARGKVLGNAVESLWHAYGAQTGLRQPWLSAGLLAVGLYQASAGAVLGPATSLLIYALTARHMAEPGRGDGRTGRSRDPGPPS